MNNNEIQTNKDKLGITSRSRSEFCDDVGGLSWGELQRVYTLGTQALALASLEMIVKKFYNLV